MTINQAVLQEISRVHRGAAHPMEGMMEGLNWILGIGVEVCGEAGHITKDDMGLVRSSPGFSTTRLWVIRPFLGP